MPKNTLQLFVLGDDNEKLGWNVQILSMRTRCIMNGLTDYQRGYLDCLRELHEVAKQDKRYKISRKLHFVSQFQRGRWSVASDIANVIDRLLEEEEI